MYAVIKTGGKQYRVEEGDRLRVEKIETATGDFAAAGFVAGQTIVDARRAMVMHEDGHAPVYYFERKEVRMDLLTPTDHASH